MNKQRFEEIGLIKYVGYFIIYAIIYSGARQVIKQDASLLSILIFLIFAWGAMMLYAYEYRDEQKYFDTTTQCLSWVECYRLLCWYF